MTLVLQISVTVHVPPARVCEKVQDFWARHCALEV
jgi:hypothetical protein